ncbi:ABC transporter ATP-binding protein [Harryflintia acetispora]|uniref:ABC-type nitrate/sulfonate/bicarbonate transport system ATPase subunit n=1 Tax=Harryflintia acetispora TaxID=1849041 RepID=A0A9X8UKF7_9FIRM|nr:ABC transporter ATP-binding protein [Harryflintia acetispora]TCL44571.1 ABC-type nitrate/sulfonate/bicarbonate transport system ATPase subunit [Harryflintia acetispora]
MSVLQAEGLCKSYDGRCVVQDISLALERGELVSLLGVSGIGKTTLFNLLSGLECPDSGRVLLEGEDVTGRSGRVSYMQQKDLLLPFRTVLDNVCLPLRLAGAAKREAHRRAGELMEEFGLGGSERRYPSELSGGMRQRAALLRAYLFSERVMLLDEPFSALDAITKSSLHRWFQSVRKKHGTSSIFITHDIDEAIFLSDRVYIMSGAPGRITAELQIELPGERDEDISMSDAFIHYKKQILQEIRS